MSEYGLQRQWQNNIIVREMLVHRKGLHFTLVRIGRGQQKRRHQLAAESGTEFLVNKQKIMKMQ